MFIIHYFHTPEQEKMEEQRERFPVQALQCINSIKIIIRFISKMETCIPRGPHQGFLSGSNLMVESAVIGFVAENDFD